MTQEHDILSANLRDINQRELDFILGEGTYPAHIFSDEGLNLEDDLDDKSASYPIPPPKKRKLNNSQENFDECVNLQCYLRKRNGAAYAKSTAHHKNEIGVGPDYGVRQSILVKINSNSIDIQDVEILLTCKDKKKELPFSVSKNPVVSLHEPTCNFLKIRADSDGVEFYLLPVFGEQKMVQICQKYHQRFTVGISVTTIQNEQYKRSYSLCLVGKDYIRDKVKNTS